MSDLGFEIPPHPTSPPSTFYFNLTYMFCFAVVLAVIVLGFVFFCFVNDRLSLLMKLFFFHIR